MQLTIGRSVLIPRSSAIAYGRIGCAIAVAIAIAIVRGWREEKLYQQSLVSLSAKRAASRTQEEEGGGEGERG